ncbi:MAG: hypothetical protein KF716_08800 [Anaerolineae bacterium]|nr:hypothetical protein [Anaerolineae bacterium]
MSYAAAIKTLLVADATLAAALTGGIYSYQDTKKLGINQVTTPLAFTAGILKPCALIKDRGETPFGGIADPNAQYVTTSQIIEIWLYDDGEAGYATLQMARDRIYALLQHNRVAGSFEIRFANIVEGVPAPELDNPAAIRADYQVIGRLKST